MSYPVIASWVSQVQQSRLIDSYQVEVNDIEEAARIAALEEAHDYNNRLKSGQAYDPYADGTQEADTDQYESYLGLLEGLPSGVMSRVRIPTIDVDLPIYHGTTERSLKRGVGHLYGTALPVGGEGTHSVLTAHSGLADATMFTNLQNVEVGEVFQLETYGEKFTYEVTEINVILPDETDILAVVPGKDLVSLITCTPVTVNSHRLVVTGERVPNPEEPSAEMPTQDLPGFPWWVVWTGLAMIGCVTYVVVGKARDARKTPETSEGFVNNFPFEFPSVRH